MLLSTVPSRPPDPPSACVDALVALGFAGLEAEVYTHLVASSPQTGYGVAKALGKPVANTYKALESLHGRGAILVEEGERRRCRAVPPDELLRQVERGFAGRTQAAAAAFAGLKSVAGDDRVYTLQSRPQVIERARTMLSEARRVALVDAFPAALELVREPLLDAHGRGVEVAVKTYGPVDLPVPLLHVDPGGAHVIARWPGTWLNLVTDGACHLLALLAPDGRSVHHAVYSASAYTSWVYHSSLAAEILLASVETAIEAGDDPRPVFELHERLAARDAPGYLELSRRFGVRSGDSARPKRERKPSRRRR